MIYDEKNGMVVFFGGDFVKSGFSDEEEFPEPYSRTWAYDVDSNKWEELKIQNTPPPRGLHGIVYDSDNNSMIIFGGIETLIDEENYLGTEFSDTWILPLENIYSTSAPALFVTIIFVAAAAITGGMIYFVNGVKKK